MDPKGFLEKSVATHLRCVTFQKSESSQRQFHATQGQVTVR
jgi:hypothetical protein